MVIFNIQMINKLMSFPSIEYQRMTILLDGESLDKYQLFIIITVQKDIFFIA